MILSKKAQLFLLPLLAGGIYALSFPNKIFPHSFIFSIIGITLLFICIDLNYSPSSKTFSLLPKLYSAFSFCIGKNIITYYWIPHTLQEFGNISPIMAYFMALLFTFILFPQIFVFLLVVGVLKKYRLKTLLRISSPKIFTFFYSLLIVIIENITPQQFPTHPGYTWMSMAPYLGPAQFFGVPIYSFFSYLLSFSLAFQIKKKVIQYTPSILFLIFLGINFITPLPSPKENAQEYLRINIVQPNIGNFLKIDSIAGNYSSIYEVLEHYKTLSLTDKKVDLIIWPETAYPHLMDSTLMKETNLFTPPVIREIVSKTQTYLLTGGYDKNRSQKNQFMNQYNASFLFNENAVVEDIYHKHKLIPFGETLPFGRFNEFIGRYISQIVFFAEGTRFTEFQLPKKKFFITVICYEILFPLFIRNYLNSVENHPLFIINLTNDSWYGNTSEPHQHLFLSKWRAVEFNLPIIRSTNTGITSILYQDGSEDERIGIGERTSKFYNIPLKRNTPTLYQRYGFLMPFSFIVLLFLIFAITESMFLNKSCFQK